VHPCSIDDRVQWFLENELFAEALELSTRNSDRLKEVDPIDVGKKFINHLIEQRDFDKAAKFLPQVLFTYLFIFYK